MSSRTKESKLKLKRMESTSTRIQDIQAENHSFTCDESDKLETKVAAMHQYQPTDLQLKKPGLSYQKSGRSDDATRTDSNFREFKRLKERIFELDDERAALTEAIGSEVGLTANMQKLHEYNTIKDMAQIIIGCLSNMLDIPVTQLHEELNLTFQE
jgi:hypothetical protein